MIGNRTLPPSSLSYTSRHDCVDAAGQADIGGFSQPVPSLPTPTPGRVLSPSLCVELAAHCGGQPVPESPLFRVETEACTTECLCTKHSLLTENQESGF